MKTENRSIMAQFENTVIRGVTVRLALTVFISTVVIVWGGSRAYNGILSEIQDVKGQNEIRKLNWML